jgi:hypothetical protein
MNADMLNVLLVWLVAFLGGVMGTLGAVQAVSGRRTYPFNPRGTNWSAGELNLLGLGFAVLWLAMAVYGLVGGLFIASHVHVPFGPLFWAPVVIASLLFQVLMQQRHSRGWPFKGQTSRS